MKNYLYSVFIDQILPQSLQNIT